MIRKTISIIKEFSKIKIAFSYDRSHHSSSLNSLNPGVLQNFKSGTGFKKVDLKGTVNVFLSDSLHFKEHKFQTAI